MYDQWQTKEFFPTEYPPPTLRMKHLEAFTDPTIQAITSAEGYSLSPQFDAVRRTPLIISRLIGSSLSQVLHLS